MVKDSSVRRGAIDFFIIIAMLLIVIVGASSAGGRLGGLGQSLNRALTGLFGEEPTQCAFLQKGALSGLLGIESTKVTQVTLNDNAGEVETSMRMRYNQGRGEVEFDIGDAPDYNTYPNVYQEDIVSVATQELIGGSTDEVQIDFDETNPAFISCTRSSGPCTCSQEDDGSETRPMPGPDTGKFYCNLRYFIMTEALGFSAQAAKDAEYAAFAASPMPSYICIVIFGFVPFMVMYYLIQDLLALVFIRHSTKKLIAVSMAAMGIVTGAFADMAYVLTKLTSISLSWSFMFMIFGTGLAAVVITNLMGLTSAASAMQRSLSEAHYGFTLLRTFGQQLEEASGRTR